MAHKCGPPLWRRAFIRADSRFTVGYEEPVSKCFDASGSTLHGSRSQTCHGPDGESPEPDWGTLRRAWPAHSLTASGCPTRIRTGSGQHAFHSSERARCANCRGGRAALAEEPKRYNPPCLEAAFCSRFPRSDLPESAQGKLFPLVLSALLFAVPYSSQRKKSKGRFG